VTPIRAPNPSPNPLRNLPPPTLPAKRRPGRPTKAEAEAAARAAANPSPASPPPPPDGPIRRELPADPAAREAALAEVAGEAELVLSILDSVAVRFPPSKKLSAEERRSIDLPLRAVLYKYGADLPPEWALAAALAGVAFGRYLEFKLKSSPDQVAA
jgi:hypothetical protein